MEYLSATDAEIVVTDALARADPVARRAARAGLVVWLAPDALVAAITRAAAISAPARVATVLARLPAIPLLRGSLRRLTPKGTPSGQLALPQLLNATESRSDGIDPSRDQ